MGSSLLHLDFHASLRHCRGTRVGHRPGRSMEWSQGFGTTSKKCLKVAVVLRAQRSGMSEVALSEFHSEAHHSQQAGTALMQSP
mgnify:CR=1 FL=1